MYRIKWFENQLNSFGYNYYRSNFKCWLAGWMYIFPNPTQFEFNVLSNILRHNVDVKIHLKIEMTQVSEISIWGHPRDHIPSGETSGSISLDWLNHFPVQGWNNGVKKGIWIQKLLSKVISYSTIYSKRLPHLSNVGQLITSKTQQGFFLF